MTSIIRNPIFLCGLLIRLVLLFCIVPLAASQWYVPFLEMTTHQLTLDPWKIFLGAGGIDTAFPYGYVMWLVFLPFTLLCHGMGLGTHFAYGLTLLVADISLLLLLRKIFKTHDRLLLLTYWLSPIILFATYWLGYNDLIPVLLLYSALYCVSKFKVKYAGVFCGAAISAKLSMILAVPFFGIYLFRNRALRYLLPHYLLGLLVTLAVCFLPFIFFPEGLYMLAHNPEMNKVYQFVINIGNGPPIYLLPMVYFLMLYLTWRIRRISFELFNALLGLSFFSVVLLTPASLGWYVWIVPLLIFYQSLSGRVAFLLVGLFSLFYVASGLLDVSLIGERNLGLIHTGLVVLGIILVLRVWHDAIRSNNYFRLSRKPFVIGIAGDSGAGKDTLVDSLVGLFGKHSVTHLSGDNYHLWDRQKPMWQVMTHLNPRANDLEQYAHDLISLTNGQSIHARHYDHQSGKMMRPHQVKSNDFIIASGLHALYLPVLRSCYDLSIYLDIDEGLRHYFKIQRDVHVRGHSEKAVLSSLAKREADSVKFVRPQAAHADLIISLQPIHAAMLKNAESTHHLSFKLFARSRYGLNEESLVRVLIGICGLHVDMEMSHDNSGVDLTIEGETTADDIALAALTLCPRINEFLDVIPRWQDGIKGLIQLVTLSHINQSLREKLI